MFSQHSQVGSLQDTANDRSVPLYLSSKLRNIRGKEETILLTLQYISSLLQFSPPLKLEYASVLQEKKHLFFCHIKICRSSTIISIRHTLPSDMRLLYKILDCGGIGAHVFLHFGVFCFLLFVPKNTPSYSIFRKKKKETFIVNYVKYF